MKVALITGSAGLVGSAEVKFFSNKGYKVVGIDNDLRSYFFGSEASTKPSLEALKAQIPSYEHYFVDIRDERSIRQIFSDYSSDIEIVVHTAAQPSHDWASKEPHTDFTVNAVGTLNLLEATRLHAPKATFIFISSNKVYGDRPNCTLDEPSYKGLRIREEETRFEAYFADGSLGAIGEDMSIDHTLHSLFGASKLSADILCQEYGRYFGLNTGIFRGGCLTGPNHAGAELHGFLSYLIKCIVGDKSYKIFGYKGKQVRDNIHSYDLVDMFWHFHLNPRPGEVYNVGGGRENSISILEAINKVSAYLGRKWQKYELLPNNRRGDHIWYITDLGKFKNHFPDWNIKISLDDTINQIVNFELGKLKSCI
jgi:CDP-paratose 2-epimerase